MERSELVSSVASGSYELTQTENDDTLSEGFSEDTLNLVEDAVLRTLTKHSEKTPERHLQESKRVGGTRLRGSCNNARDEEHQSAVSESAPPVESSNPDDMELLANVLEQVHDLRNQRQGSRKPKGTSPDVQDVRRPPRRRGREKKSSSSSEELRISLEAAAMAANAAAAAAEAAALSVVKNTEAIEFIVNSMKSSKERRKSKRVSDEKAIAKSNQRTHWILGFMAITTIAWRFRVVKVAKSVSSKLIDPLGYVGGLIGNNDDSSNEKPVEKAPEKGNLLDKLPHFDMPEFLPNDSDHKAKEKETKSKENNETKAKETNFFSKAPAVDVKTKEKTAFSFASLLQIKPSKT